MPEIIKFKTDPLNSWSYINISVIGCQEWIKCTSYTHIELMYAHCTHYLVT